MVLLLKCVGPSHKYIKSNPTELPTELSNITTGDSKYPQSSGVGGAFEEGKCSDANDVCTWVPAVSPPHGTGYAHTAVRRLFRLPQRPHIDRKWSPAPAAPRRSAAARRLIDFYTHLPTWLSHQAATGHWLSERWHWAPAQESRSIKLASSLTEKLEDIGRTRKFKTFGNMVNEDIVRHKMKV